MRALLTLLMLTCALLEAQVTTKVKDSSQSPVAGADNPHVIGWTFQNQTPYAETATLNIARRLTSSLLLEVGYAGARGIHQTGMHIDEVEPGFGTLTSKHLIQAPEQRHLDNALLT